MPVSRRALTLLGVILISVSAIAGTGAAAQGLRGRSQRSRSEAPRKAGSPRAGSRADRRRPGPAHFAGLPPVVLEQAGAGLRYGALRSKRLPVFLPHGS
jgi:hypothetical protein